MNKKAMELEKKRLKVRNQLPKLSRPAQESAYLSGFEAAITLFDQYFENEGISYEEARFRVDQIKSVMVSTKAKSSFNNMKNKKTKLITK